MGSRIDGNNGMSEEGASNASNRHVSDVVPISDGYPKDQPQLDVPCKLPQIGSENAWLIGGYEHKFPSPEQTSTPPEVTYFAPFNTNDPPGDTTHSDDEASRDMEKTLENLRGDDDDDSGRGSTMRDNEESTLGIEVRLSKKVAESDWPLKNIKMRGQLTPRDICNDSEVMAFFGPAAMRKELRITEIGESIRRLSPDFLILNGSTIRVLEVTDADESVLAMIIKGPSNALA